MPLRIHFERTGGFAGPAMRRSCMVDADALPAPEAEELRSLVQSTNLASPPPPSASVRPDAFHYRLSIETDDHHHTLEFGDHDMPASLRPLVHWLSQRAAPGHKE
jgi:hypothetical protein